MKICTNCQIAKSVSEFYKRKMSQDGLQPICKSCDAERGKYVRSRKGHMINARRRVAYTVNPDTTRARNARYRVENKDRLSESTKEWKRNNPENLAANTARRKAAKLKATPGWADEEKIQEFYELARLLELATGEKHHVDHIVPLQSKLVCGLHCEQNLQVIPRSDNVSKRNLFWPDMP